MSLPNDSEQLIDTTTGTYNQNVEEEEDDFAFQLRQEEEERRRLAETAASATTTQASTPSHLYTDPNDGTVYEWDYEKKAWFPKIDNDFIARYQAQYGCSDQVQAASSAQVQQEPVQPAVVPQPSVAPKNEMPEGLSAEERKEWLKQRKKEKRKLTAEHSRQQRQWFELDESNNKNVYVSGLPLDITLKEFEEIMTKYGIINRDLETKQPKLKLYKDSDGNVKGDGLCTYVKKESVDLALQILHDSDIRGHKVQVQRAQFEQKGDYDPSKKKKKLSAKQKKKLQEKQERLFDWRPDKLRGERPKSDCTVILKNLFTKMELMRNPALLMEMQDELKIECAKYGELKKVVVYDNTDGIASVVFKEPEFADDCITMMDWRQYKGKQLRAERWDGKTKYFVEETEEERRQRLAQWEKYLESETAAKSAAAASADSA